MKDESIEQRPVYLQELFISNLEKFLKFDAEKNKDLLLKLNELKQGFCFELSLTHGVMRQAKRLTEWHKTYEEILSWSGKQEDLTAKMQQSFLQFARGLLKFPPGSAAIYPMLADGSELTVTTEAKPAAIKVAKFHLMAGNFAEPKQQIKAQDTLLQETLANIQKLPSDAYICLMRGNSHCCELHFNGSEGGWSLFDSMNEKNRHVQGQVGVSVFKTNEFSSLIAAIKAALKHDLGLYLLELPTLEEKKLKSSAINPFQNYYTYIKQPGAEDFFCKSKLAKEMLSFDSDYFVKLFAETELPTYFPRAIRKVEHIMWDNAMESGLDAMEGLIRLGADINCISFNQDNSLLIEAVLKNNVTVVDYLVSKKVNLDYQNASYETALMCVAKQGNLAMLIKLQEAGAKYGKKDTQRQTALMLAAKAGHTDVVEYLVKGRHESLFDTNLSNQNILSQIVESEQVEVLKFILLHLEKYLQNGKHAKNLYKWFAHQDFDGETATSLAARTDNEDVPILLKQFEDKLKAVLQQHLTLPPVSASSSSHTASSSTGASNSNLVREVKEPTKLMSGMKLYGFHAEQSTKPELDLKAKSQLTDKDDTASNTPDSEVASPP